MKLTTSIMGAAIALSFACNAGATAMTANDIKAEKQRIENQYDNAKKQCDTLKGNAEDICVAQAKGNRKIAEATLEMHQNDTVKTRYNVRMAQAEASHDLAKEKCDDFAGTPKDICAKDAEAAFTSAKADAKVDKKAGEAVTSASADINEAKQDAAADKRDANYAAAKERCDVYSGDAKDRCVAETKARTGKK